VSEDQLYKIEKNIPISTTRKRRNGKSNFLRSLSIGDSFKYRLKEGEKLGGNWYSLARNINMKLATRKIKENVYRIWVIEKDGVKLDEQR
tara:strand:- start:1148 stop:1417 length:270 start_codon:yes stop_codon:yes gene_type:complete